MDRKSDVTEWQKKAIVLGRKHRHSIKEVAEFVGYYSVAQSVAFIYNEKIWVETITAG